MGQAGRDGNAPVAGERQVGDGVNDASDDGRAGRTRRHEHELVTAPAGDRVDEADGLPDDRRHLAQDVVAGRFAVALVERVEAIDVEDRER